MRWSAVAITSPSPQRSSRVSRTRNSSQVAGASLRFLCRSLSNLILGEALPEPFPERFKLARSTEPVHDNPIAPEAGDRPFGPDAVSESFAFGVGEPSDGFVRGADALPRRLLPDGVTHPHHGEASLRRDPDELLLSAPGHPRDAQDLHAGGKERAT